MPSASGLTPERAKELKDQNWSHAEIAEEYGLTVSGVHQILRAGGYTRKVRLSHKKALPWTVDKSHQQAREARYLRHLSTLAQGGKINQYETTHRDLANTAIRWANRLLDAGKDISYDEYHGFVEITADPENWHLKKLMQRVITAQTRKL